MKRGLALLFVLGCGSDSLGDAGPLETTPPEWYCLDQEPAMAAREPGRVQYTLAIADDQSASPVPDLQVQVCADAACSAELPLCEDGGEPCYGLSVHAELPVLTFDFPYGLDGALRFSAPGYIDLDYLLGGPMVGSPDGSLTVSGQALAMVSVASMDKLHRDLGRASVDPARGTLITRTLDCSGSRAAGVALQPLSGDFSDADPFVMTNYGYVSTSEATDVRGEAGFSHVAPQNVVVAAAFPDGPELVRSEPIHVRPNAVTMAELRVGIGVWGR